MKILQNTLSVLIKTLSALFIIATMVAGCEKNNDQPAGSSSIEGNWAGKRGDGPETPDYDFRFTIKHGGIIQATNGSGAIKGSGTWTLNGTEFNAHYQFVAPLLTKYQVKATYDRATGKLINGKWGFDDGLYDEGTWYMDKLK